MRSGNITHVGAPALDDHLQNRFRVFEHAQMRTQSMGPTTYSLPVQIRWTVGLTFEDIFPASIACFATRMHRVTSCVIEDTWFPNIDNQIPTCHSK